MNIASFIGSLRKQSFNRMVYDFYRTEVAKDARFVEIDTGDFPPFNSDIQSDYMRQVKPKSNAILNADAVMFFSPEYNHSLPGHLKNAIDWISTMEPQPFKFKKAVVIGATPGSICTARMQIAFREVASSLELNLLHKPEVLIGFVDNKFDNKGQLTDEKTKAFLHHHWQQFKHFIHQS